MSSLKSYSPFKSAIAKVSPSFSPSSIAQIEENEVISEVKRKTKLYALSRKSIGTISNMYMSHRQALK